MPATIIVNNMTVVHKKSGGVSTAFPDVCKTPSPAGPIPIPYPNIATSSDTADGTKKVKMDAEPIMHEGSNFKLSTGDEAGSAQGVVSNKIKGKAYPKAYSMDVKAEGKAVFRQLDIMLQNGGSPTNTPPGPEAQAPAKAKLKKKPPEVLSAEWNSTKQKCGDEVVAKIETKNFDDGDIVGVTATTDPTSSVVGNFVHKVKGNKANIPWVTRTGPLPKKGGVKIDLFASGAGGGAMSGTPLEIEVPAPAKWDNNPAAPLTVPMLIWKKPNWFQSLFGTSKGKWIADPSGGYWGWDWGFEVEISHRGFFVRGRIKLEAPTHPVTGKVKITAKKKKKWKREIESVWNNQWREHRSACKRGDKCNCGSGCCNFPYRFVCEFVAGGQHASVEVYPGSPKDYLNADGSLGLWWNSGTWFEKLSGYESNAAGVWAHEYGHVIGQYDEYPKGAIQVPFTGSAASPTLTGQPGFADVKDSLMGSGSKIKKNHLDRYHDWFRKQVGEAYERVEV